MTTTHRSYRRGSRSLWVALIAAIVVLLRFLFPSATPEQPDLLEEGVHRVQRVVDGDTLLLASGARVRLEGIDTPETVREDYPVEPWGPEASQFTKDFVNRSGGQVRLTFDLVRKDRFDRFLAFVWSGEEMLNEELILAGLARARLDFEYSSRMKKRFREAEEEARRMRRGIWSGNNSGRSAD